LAEVLAMLYIIFSILLLPHSYNCLYLVYAASSYSNRKKVRLKNHPKVSVHLPVYNEKYVVSRLIRAVCSLDWPRSRLEILVLDDSADETSSIVDSEVAHFRSRGVDIRLIRRGNRSGFKAGALQNALEHTQGKYVAIFDADFVPEKGFLNETVPLLEGDPGLGMVQARWGHVNRDYSLLTETIALSIDGHHLIEQSGRCAGNLLINFNGSAGVLRTEAIRDAGGWAGDTLSEDMDLSYRMHLAGWRAHYLRDVVVPGEVPPSMGSFKSQQARWAKGSIQCGRKLLRRVWASNNLSVPQKVEATIHLTNYAVHLLVVLMLLVTVPMLATDSFYSTRLIFPYFLISAICCANPFIMYYAAVRGQGMSLLKNVRSFALLTLVGLGLSAECSLSVIRGLISYGGFFNRTPKYNISSRRDRWKDKAYSHLRNPALLECFLLAYSAIGVCLSFTRGVWPIGYYLALYLAGYASVILFNHAQSKEKACATHRERPQPVESILMKE